MKPRLHRHLVIAAIGGQLVAPLVICASRSVEQSSAVRVVPSSGMAAAAAPKAGSNSGAALSRDAGAAISRDGVAVEKESSADRERAAAARAEAGHGKAAVKAQRQRAPEVVYQGTRITDVPVVSAHIRSFMAGRGTVAFQTWYSPALVKDAMRYGVPKEVPLWEVRVEYSSLGTAGEVLSERAVAWVYNGRVIDFLRMDAASWRVLP